MQVLFVHQNFPGQFEHLAPALAAVPANRVVAMRYGKHPALEHIETIDCQSNSAPVPGGHPWLKDFNAQVRLGQASARAASRLKQQGFVPDLIVGHPGWGEMLFLKDVWPDAPILAYHEFHYRLEGAEVGFDPEFDAVSPDMAYLLRMKNTAQMHAFCVASAMLCPTQWQCAGLAERDAALLRVIHDGIDTAAACPKPDAFVSIQSRSGDTLRFQTGDEVITFVNRSLEPVRGFHIFMRALPEVLRHRPGAHVVVVGGNDLGYGTPPRSGGTWRDYMLREVADRIDLARIHFVGRIPKQVLLELLQVSSLHVYLTYPFVLSWSLLEAMGVGCRILASRTAPVIEFVRDGVNGTLFNFFSPGELAARAIEILSHPARFEAQRHAARRTIVERCDLRSVCLPAQLALVRELARA